ncbi:hypothetical protein PC129_g11884 [Phytophthora cactorum]|uniref:Uncharacterized protein n=1 Tax=Phytophthora cactorum TaxID=29920 RepID=A0A329SG75_9STRA|nr:hypothetical protein Pcac1_g2697 [Phytophthora cactorum]KAG2823716.1 hypothetical protein PC111_g10112 [Phytophthora cactorum]KAG2845707.1 hypothetical protein PC112_g1767 [Phytophthora cactorum]KAG2868067.1 hypothetical protein PC113_g1432 [Phytophthora cactorum]KAG2897834.1 hypothetical protein PC114_g14519 [Phytophthora cactorum]
MEEELTQAATLNEYNSQDQEEVEGQTSHWVECYSDNGERYFTNTVTGETSWTKPGSDYEQLDQAGLQPVDGVVEPNAADTSVEDEVIAAQDNVPNESSEVTLWLELYDQDLQTMYYFAPQFGEFRWEPPLEAINLVRHCDNDAVLSAVVPLQSAARSQQARVRVTAMRQQKMNEHSEGSNIDKEISRPRDHVEVNDEIHVVAAPSSTEDPAPPNHDSQWVEVFDPATQQQYYYSPRTSETRWDPPETFVSSLEDRKVTAAISIQSLSRGRIARKKVHQLRARSPLHHTQHSFQDESERETICCREMRHQELLQIESGDRFWGLDNYERELLQKHAEEERTNASNGQNSSASPRQTNEIRIPLDYLDFEDEEIDPERLKREQQEELDARNAMHCEETQQCQNGDIFWGIQAEETRQHTANIAMAQEETASRRFAMNVLEQALSATWEAEVQQYASKELAARGGQEQRMQARYLRWFYQQCVSVDELLDYRWPTKQQQECSGVSSSPVKRRWHPVVRPHPESVASATPYPLDDLVFRDRLEHGDLRYGLRSVLTVHHQNSRGTSGTHFEITKSSPECAFDEATAAALLKKQTLEYYQYVNDNDSLNGGDDRVRDGSQEGEITPGSSIDYRRSRTPDPHVPARFNGVPYKPNQISPTQEILSGDHRKLNQLPSLAKQKPTESPKLRQLQKAKTKARTNPKVSSPVAQQSPNNRNGYDSASEREVDQAENTEYDGPHAQFKRQEHQVLSKLFSLMDLDGSGTVNQDEMRWALQRDAEIHALARTSPLLSVLLKQRTRLEALFSNRTVNDPPSPNMDEVENSNELSWDQFLERCEYSYLRLMSEGLIQPDAVATDRGDRSKIANDGKSNYQDGRSQSSAKEIEAQTIRRVFALLDSDGNGVVDVAEVQRTLYNSAVITPKNSSGSGAVSTELRALVEGSRALQPMLHQELFMTAFTKFEPMDPRGISEEEFVAFCLEIAQVAAANNMMATVG